MSKVLARRHIAKSISYRCIGTFQTALFGYLMTGSWKIASSLGVIELCVKPVIYFIHERVWYRWVKYGVIEENVNVGTGQQ
jgi:uncharacterized membrane protein